LVSVLRSRSVIDDIGNIQYNASRTIVVLRIEDENDNRPQFDIISPLTVGYPNVEIANQLLPPYLTKIQVSGAQQHSGTGIVLFIEVVYLRTFQSKHSELLY
jgi:hypothetical protein